MDAKDIAAAAQTLATGQRPPHQAYGTRKQLSHPQLKVPIPKFRGSHTVLWALTRGGSEDQEEHSMEQATSSAAANMTGKPLIESDRVEGTTVHDMQGNNLGSIKRLMIDKITGQVAYAVMSFGGFLGMGAEEYPVPWRKLTYDTQLGGYRTDITEQELRARPAFGSRSDIAA